MWTEKYSPSSTGDLVGQKTNNIRKWYSNPKKPLLLHGPPGTGKTSTAHAIAREHNLDVVEVNASDYRTTSEIEKRIKPAIKQKSLFNKGKIILIDEIDGLTRQDRGAIPTLKKIVKNSKFPIIFTANDAYNPKLRELRSFCELLEFKRITDKRIKTRLGEIAKEENVEIDDLSLRKIASQAGGDMRSAVANLESFSITGNDDFDYKERGQDIFNTLKIIFKTSTMRTAKDAMDSSNKSFDEIFWWLEQNIPNEYERKEEIAKALEYLSISDIFQGRIYKSQDYSLMKYQLEFMAAVSLAKKERYKKFTYYKPPQRLIKYGRSKSTRAKKKRIAEKLCKRLGVSRGKFFAHYVPFLKIMLQNKEWKKEFIEEYDLDKKDLKAMV